MNHHKIFILLLLFNFILPNLLFTQIDNSYNNSIDLFNNKLYSTAHQKFLSLIDSSQNIKTVEDSYYYAALCSYYLKNYYNAMSEFTSLLINFPNTKHYKNTKKYIAFSYFYSKNYVYSIKNLKNYLREFPDEKNDNSIHLFMAYAYFYMEYYDKALPLFQKLLQIKSIDDFTKYKIIFYMGQIHFYNKNHIKALKNFNIVTLKCKNSSLKNYSLFFIGMINFYLEKYEASIRNFKLLTTGKKINEDLAALSELFINIQNNNLTEPLLYNIINKNKQSKELLNFAYLNLSSLYIKNNDLNKAKSILEEGLSLNFMQDYYFHFLSQLYILKQDYEHAEKLLKKIINDYPFSPFSVESLYNLGIINQIKGDTITALKYFYQVSSKSLPKDLFIRNSFQSGKIEYKNKNFKKAKKYFLSIIKPENKNSLFFRNSLLYVSDILIQNKKHNENTKLLIKYAEKLNDHDINHRLALSYYNNKKYKKSLYLINKILTHSDDMELNYKTLIVLINIGEILTDDVLLTKYLFKFRDNKYLPESQYIDYIIKLCIINYKNKNYKKAIQNLLYSTTLDNNLEQKKKIYFNLYKNYKALHLKEKAIKTLSTLINMEDDEEQIKYYLKIKEELSDED